MSVKPSAQAQDEIPAHPVGLSLGRIRPLGMVGFGVLAALVILLDQASKIWIRHHVGPRDEIVVIPRLLNIIHRGNTGAAFSAFDDKPAALQLFAVLVATVLLVWSFRLKGAERAFRWPLALVFGGAVGNLVDRFRIGHVTDMIDAHWNNVYHFATFNVADSGICVGMAILIFLNLFVPSRPEKQ